MFRGILYLVIGLLVLTLVRSIVGIITKGFADLFTQGEASAPSRGPSAPSSGGELKKDPVCGTFISPKTAFQKAAGGQTYYFCSTACRDKFTG